MCTGYISPSNGLGKYPKLRFKGFSEPFVVRKIGTFAKCYAGATPSTKDRSFWDNGTIPWLSSGEVNKKHIDFTDTYITQKGFENCSTKMVPSGTVVMALAGQGKTRGTVAITNIDLCTNQSLAAIVTDDSVCDLCLLYYLETQYENLRAVSSGDGTRGGLNLQIISDYPVCLPSIGEQIKIADFFAVLDKKIEKQHTLIETLKKYKRGLLQQIFSRKLIMTVGDESWEYIPLGEIGCFFGGLTGKSKEDFDHGDSKFITYMNVYKNTFADETMVTAVDVAPNEKQNTVQYGDILFTQSSETVEEVGLSSVWVHDTTPYLNSFCMALRPRSLEKYNPYYLGYALRSPKIREAIMKEGQGISRINLAASRIENIPIPIPPAAVQIKIADYLKKWDDRIYANEKTLTELISLKKAFLQSLFI